MSMETTALWLVGYFGNQSFPPMQQHFGNDATFWWFSFAAFTNFLCVFLFVPETKGRSLEEITSLWTSVRRSTPAEMARAEPEG